MENVLNMQRNTFVCKYLHLLHSVVKVIIVLTVIWPMSKSYTQCPQECINFNTLFGKDAGAAITTGKSNSFFGQNAGKNNTSGDANSFFGLDAGLSNTIGDSNSFFGFAAGSSNTTGHRNSFFGQSAGSSNTYGVSNSFFGYSVGQSNTSGSNNSFFGTGAGINLEGGDYNCFFGSWAGAKIVLGGSNCFFGPFAGAEITGSSNICIGREAGPTSQNGNVSGRLYIDIEQDNDPLIYGEFSNDFVKINGTFEVTAGLTNPSSIALKKDFEFVNRTEVLNKISQLNIQEWSYKHDPEVRHVGPTAEAFYAAFNLGAGSKTISTIDADGIALLAIQALKEQVDALRAEIEALKSKN